MTRTGKVLWSERMVSHEELISEHKLKDDRLGDRDFVKFEITPKSMEKVTRSRADWQFKVDEEGTLPEWFLAKRKLLEVKCWAAWTDSVKVNLAVGDEKIEVKNRYVLAAGNANVVAYGSSKVEAYNSSNVEAYGSSKVVACDSSKVEAYNSSNVVACGSSNVEAYGSSNVEAYGSSIIRVCSSSVKVTAKEDTILLYESKTSNQVVEVCLRKGVKVEYREE